MLLTLLIYLDDDVVFQGCGRTTCLQLSGPTQRIGLPPACRCDSRNTDMLPLQACGNYVIMFYICVPVERTVNKHCQLSHFRRLLRQHFKRLVRSIRQGA